MLCTACGNHTAVVGRFCSHCDGRARSGVVERRRPVGGAQWQALWGINYAPQQHLARRRRHWQGGLSIAVIVIGILLTF